MAGNPKVEAVAAVHNVSTAQVALRWVAQQPGLFVTSGENPEYLQEDMHIFGFNLTDTEMQTLANI